MAEHWNPDNSPPLNLTELRHVVHSAYVYGGRPPGSESPEADFGVQKIAKTNGKHRPPLAKLNDEYAFVIMGSTHRILWETEDVGKRKIVKFLKEEAFHRKFANVKIQFNSKPELISKVWSEWPGRREYKGITFIPGREISPNWFNLWRGFSVKPVAGDCSNFLNHIKIIICKDDEALYNWVIGWFAQMVQEPWVKLSTSIVLRGKRRTGKSMIGEVVGSLFFNHYTQVSNPRHVLGNFNAHMAQCLLLQADEAFWAGNKNSEGALKALISDKAQMLERKSIDAEQIQNYIRLLITSNSDWVVPVTADEKRYAVLDVCASRANDIPYFKTIHKELAAGGKEALLHYLMNWDYSGINLRSPPKTEALLDQKRESAEPIEDWWREGLIDGVLFNVESLGHAERWPRTITTAVIRASLKQYYLNRNIKTRLPNCRGIGRTLRQFTPSITRKRSRSSSYSIPPLDAARIEYETYIGHAIDWDEL